jgi:nicotinamidase-related amidase
MPPARNHDLHGNVPDESDVALLLIDVINDLEFEGGERDFGRWRSDFSALLARVLGHDVRGRPIAERLRPEPTDYVVLKPKHSAFYSTTLDLLLRYLKTRALVIGGFTADRCVLFTASDAYLRDFRVVVPSDGVASLDRAANRLALSQMRTLLGADVRPSRAVLLRRALRPRGRAGAA